MSGGQQIGDLLRVYIIKLGKLLLPREEITFARGQVAIACKALCLQVLESSIIFLGYRDEPLLLSNLGVGLIDLMLQLCNLVSQLSSFGTGGLSYGSPLLVKPADFGLQRCFHQFGSSLPAIRHLSSCDANKVLPGMDLVAVGDHYRGYNAALRRHHRRNALIESNYTRYGHCP